MTSDPLSGDNSAPLMRVRPAVEAALRNPKRRLPDELQTLCDRHSAESRLWAIQSWLVVLASLNAIMLRGDSSSGPLAYEAGFVMRLEINLPLAAILFIVLPRVPDIARGWLFAAFNLMMLATICIQAQYAAPAFAMHHLILAAIVIGAYNVLVPDTLHRATRFTVAALVVFIVASFAPIGPNPHAPADMTVLVLAFALVTLRARYALQIAARETFLLRLRDSMNAQDVIFANRILVDLSHTDPLTQVANRRCFDDRMGSYLHAGTAAIQPMAMLMIDVDFFDIYHDRYGQPASDLCLRTVAQTMKRELRGGQDMLARYGGEAFAVLLPGLKTVAAQTIGERLCQRVQAVGQAHDGRPDEIGHVTVSIGAVSSTDAGVSTESLVKLAELAVYEAKRRGGNRVCTASDVMVASRDILPPPGHADSVTSLSRSASLADDLRNAMFGGHLHLQYQPIYDARSGDIAAVEALLRWTHPQRGSISPGAFIPAAEESGMIVPIGKWVLRQACVEAASWTIPHIVTVNVSPVQFSDPGLVSTLSAILTEAGLKPERLLLEITEGLQLILSDGVRETLLAIRALGIGLALDDFGTGYANLSRLRMLSFDVIKIDRSFLDDVGDGTKMMEVLTPLVAFARAYGPKIAMEGVETADQLALVKALGCDWAQGFYLGQPMPPEDLRSMIRTARCPLNETALLTN